MRSAVPQKFRLGNAARKSVMKALMSSRPLARLMQRVFQQHVRRRNLVDHTQIAGLAPKIGEPTADNSLVVILQAHGSASRLLPHRSPDGSDDLCMRSLLWSPTNSGSYPRIELKASRPFAAVVGEAALVPAASQSDLKA